MANPPSTSRVPDTDSTTHSSILSPLLSEPLQLSSVHRVRRRPYELKSVHPADALAAQQTGWCVQRAGKRATRLKRSKRHDKWLEDRLWCLAYQMGYPILSEANCKLSYTRRDSTVGTKQIDLYAEDSETALVVECKARETRGRRSLQKDIRETISLQTHLRRAINSRFSDKPRPKIIWLYATANIIWSKSDLERAQEGSIHVITENELQYFETFIKHMGPAGKYQILGAFLKGQKVPGLTNVRLPAIRGRLGGEKYYSFVTTPRQLLKIAFVNHQALNHPDGLPAYQRMISASPHQGNWSFHQDRGIFSNEHSH